MARLALEQSGADGVMIGRGAQGKPWRLAEIAADIYGTQPPVIPTGSDLIDMVSGHYDAMLRFYGAELGNRVARKHLGWYMDDTGTPQGLRKAILTSKDSTFVVAALADALVTDTRRAA